MSIGEAEDEAVSESHQLRMSLAGALAYFARARVDILVFVRSSQRHTHTPNVERVRKLRTFTLDPESPREADARAFYNRC
jgi:hypothetical protein